MQINGFTNLHSYWEYVGPFHHSPTVQSWFYTNSIIKSLLHYFKFLWFTNKAKAFSQIFISFMLFTFEYHPCILLRTASGLLLFKRPVPRCSAFSSFIHFWELTLNLCFPLRLFSMLFIFWFTATKNWALVVKPTDKYKDHRKSFGF